MKDKSPNNKQFKRKIQYALTVFLYFIGVLLTKNLLDIKFMQALFMTFAINIVFFSFVWLIIMLGEDLT